MRILLLNNKKQNNLLFMAMKWKLISKAKENELVPGKPYLTLNDNLQWDKMDLEEIKISSNGRTYIFRDFQGSQYIDCAYYMDIDNAFSIVEPPKNNQ